MTASSPPGFFTAGLSQAEIEYILQRIDENLELRQILSRQPAAAAVAAPLPPLPEVAGAYVRLDQLRRLGELLYVTTGRFAPDMARRLVNLPIRAFARKQIYHNREMQHLMADVLAQIEALRPYAAYLQQHVERGADLGALHQAVTGLAQQLQEQAEALEQARQARQALQQRLEERVEELAAAVRQQQERLDQTAETEHHHADWLDQVSATARQHDEWLTKLTADDARINAWLEQVANNQQSQNEWMTILANKLMMLALDVREQQDAGAHAASIPEPQIVDPPRFQARLAEMGGAVRVNLGSGEKPLPEYLNVDYRSLPGIDIIADVRKLPFEPGTLAEIMSAHLVEHFREHQMRRRILPYWRSLLAPGGILRVICPNWAAMLQLLNSGQMSLADFRLLTFGAQDYEGDDHFAMYTPETLAALLTETGFHQIDVIAVDRMNGKCPEMELVAHT